MFEQGGIYLVNFNPSKGTEAGKVRPALVIQSDMLNELSHLSTLVMPLTTQLSSEGNVLRFRVSGRDKLKQHSDVMLDQVRAIDNRRFCSECLAQLSGVEWQVLREQFLKLI